ncbi:MAG: hypothetical protein IJT50_04640 [Lentisphaeria bacterium]|nr:hypothetical protein [Lentisphaeria bacterium]
MKNLLVSLLAAAGVCAYGATFYDLGAPDSPVRKNFKPLTLKNGSWQGKKLAANVNKIVRKAGVNKSSGRAMPPVYFNELTCDGIVGTGPATLTLPAPDGPCVVWILSGRAGGLAAQVWDITVTANGKSVSTTYPGPAAIEALELATTVKGGKLKLDFTTRSKWLVNAIAVIPAGEYAAAKAKTIDREMFEVSTLPPEILAKWKKLPYKSDIPEPKWTDAQKKAGFALFSRNWTEPVWPEQFPRRSEIDAPVRAFCTIGEGEPLTFSIYPLKNFKEVTLSVAPFVDGAGNTLGPDAVTPRYVKYSWVRPNYSMTGFYYRAPEVLMPWTTRSLKAKEPLRIWLSVQTQPTVKPGMYRSTALLTLDGKKVSVPLTLRVLPIRLLKNDKVYFAQYYHHPYTSAGRATDDFSRRWWTDRAEYEHAHMRDSGMEGITSNITFTKDRKTGKFTIFFDNLQRQIDLMRKYNMGTMPLVCGMSTGGLYSFYFKNQVMGSHLSQLKMPPKAFFDDITEVTRLIQAEAKRRGWPELLYYPIDEPVPTGVAGHFMAELMKAIKRVPGVRTYVTAAPTTTGFEEMAPYVDVWCMQRFVVPKAEAEANMKKYPGLEYWAYPNHNSGENDHTLTVGSRMTYGFGLWQSGYRVLIPWIYSSTNQDPWNNLDGSSADFGVRTAPDGRPIPTPIWEAFREGIDDGKYIHTLEVLIDRAEAAGLKQAAAEAKADLELVRKNIFIQIRYRDENLWGADTFDAYRWLIARSIMKLQDLLK